MSSVPKTKIFVGRLPEGCTSRDLEDLFSKYGTVSECDVVGKFGFVHMSKDEEADECVKKLNKYSFMGSQLSVEFSTSRVHPEPGTTGRAKGPSRPIKRSDKGNPRNGPYSRNSYEPPRGSMHGPPHGPPSGPPPRDGYAYSSYYPEDYRYERDPYYDRDPYYGRDRARPYPAPYERRSYDYDDYLRRPYSGPLPPPPANIYARRSPSRDPYDRRNDVSTPMYSTRSPPHNMHPGTIHNARSSEYWNYPYENDYANRRANRYDDRQIDAASPPTGNRRLAY